MVFAINVIRNLACLKLFEELDRKEKKSFLKCLVPQSVLPEEPLASQRFTPMYKRK